MNKHVLITGGSRGIGKELVCTFAKEGFHVSFTYCKSEKEAKFLTESVGACGYCIDFSKPEAVLHFAEKFLQDAGPVDVLINNAGISHYGLFQDASLEDIKKLSAVNFESPVLLTKALVPFMIQRKSGSVINIASIWGQCGASCEVLYSATKAALIGFTKALAKELAPSGISVNCVAPGAVDTQMLSCFTEEEKGAIAQESPLGRLIGTDEIAATCLFLAKRSAPALTGQVIGINGGLYC